MSDEFGQVLCSVCGGLIETNASHRITYATCYGCQDRQRRAQAAAVERAVAKHARPAPTVQSTVGATSSNTSTGCGTVVVVMVLLAMAYFVIKAILPYLIASAVVIVLGGIFIALARKVGIGKAALVCALPGLIAFLGLRSYFASHEKEVAKEEQQSRKAEAKEKAKQAKVRAVTRADFESGYAAAAKDGSALASTLVGSWKGAEGSWGPAPVTFTASMVTGVDPTLSKVLFKLDGRRLVFSGQGTDSGSSVPCAGAAEPIVTTGRLLLAVECLKTDGEISWHAYTGSDGKLLAKFRTSKASSQENGLIPKALRGAWLASDSSCRKLGNRRTIVTASMIIGNGGNEEQGVFEVSTSSAENGAIVLHGAGGSSSGSKSCSGRIEPSDKRTYILNIRCQDQTADPPSHLCRKTASWRAVW